MNFFTDFLDIITDLEELKKKVYLDTPEVFVDLSDKIDSKQFDEMVLFFATKYDYLSIVKFIISNNLVNLNMPSKNSQFKTIKDHILEASKQFNAQKINDFLSNLNEDTLKKDSLEASLEEGLESFIKSFENKLTDLCNQIDDICNEDDKTEDTTKASENIEVENKENIENIEIKEADGDCTADESKQDVDKSECQDENPSGYKPKFICPNCSCNIFEEGYSVSEKVSYKYSQEENKIVKVSSEQANAVICNKCNYTIEQLNPLFLENISTVQNCKNCGKDLTKSGITTKLHSEYDKESNCFVAGKKTYHCGECNHELNDYQINYFSL